MNDCIAFHLFFFFKVDGNVFISESPELSIVPGVITMGLVAFMWNPHK